MRQDTDLLLQRPEGDDPALRRHTLSGEPRLWLGLVAVLALIAAGAAVWVDHTSAFSADSVLHTSDPQAPRAGREGPGVTVKHGSPPGREAIDPTPAEVGQAAPSQVAAERPRMLTLASGTTMPVRVSATATSGELKIPTDINQAGWWDGGSRLGDPFGAIVLAAHVDSFTQGIGRFAELLSVHSGDVLRLNARHLSQKFRVVAARLVPKTAITATSDVYSADGRPRLVLITCGGSYDPSHGGYQSNMVVIAVPKGHLTVAN